MNPNLWIPILGLAGLAAAFMLERMAPSLEDGSLRARDITRASQAGAELFVGRAFFLLLAVAAGFAAVLFTAFRSWHAPLAFLVGVLCAASAVCLGVRAVTRAIGRTADAADEGGPSALLAALGGGSAMGLASVSLGMLGLGSVYLLFISSLSHAHAVHAFGLGAVAVAILVRMGGGILAAGTRSSYSGSAKPGSHNTGVDAGTASGTSLEAAGMCIYLFTAWCGAVLSVIAISGTLSAPVTAVLGPSQQLMLLPLVLAAAGLACSALGMGVLWLVSNRPAVTTLRSGLIVSDALFILAALAVVMAMDISPAVWLCVLAGAVGRPVVGLVTTYYSVGGPGRSVTRAAGTGAATAMIRGLAVGMESLGGMVLATAVIILAAVSLMPVGAGLYGVAIAAVGLLSTFGMSTGIEAGAAIVGGARAPEDVARPEAAASNSSGGLDEAARMAAVAGGGVALVAGGLSALALTGAYFRTVSLQLPEFAPEIGNPMVLAGMCLGGIVPFVVGALAISAANGMVSKLAREARRQSKGRSDVDIATGCALRHLLLPGALALLAPIMVGFALGPDALGGLLAGAWVSGFLLAVAMTVSGVAWTGVRRMNVGIERAEELAVSRGVGVVSSVVGASFQFAGGPALGILIIAMAMVSLVIAPLLTG